MNILENKRTCGTCRWFFWGFCELHKESRSAYQEACEDWTSVAPTPMFKCIDCGHTFIEPKIVRNKKTGEPVRVCPKCGSRRLLIVGI